MKIKELKELGYNKLYKRALELQKKRHPNFTGNGEGLGLAGSFLFSKTEEGDLFWRSVDREDFKEAKKIRPELFEDSSSEDYPEYYKCVGSSSNFTYGKIYKCLNPKNLNSSRNFLDDRGIRNGFGLSNKNKFVPSTKEAFEAQDNITGISVVCGLNRGDTFNSDVLSRWAKESKNAYFSNLKREWKIYSGGFMIDKSIEGFKNLDGHWGFLLSKTNGVYLRCKGFLEFIEKSKKEKEAERIKKDIGELVATSPRSTPERWRLEYRSNLLNQYPLTPEEVLKPPITINNNLVIEQQKPVTWKKKKKKKTWVTYLIS